VGETVDLTGAVAAVNDDQSFVDVSRAGVRYQGNDPTVLTVERTGRVTAVGDGVATVMATVDGVDGSAVFAVRGELVLAAPGVVEPGTTVTAATTFHNGATGSKERLTMALSAASGWTVTATSPTTFDSVHSGQSVRTTWDVSVPAAAAPGSYPLTATARYQGARRVNTASTQLSVPYPSLVAAFGNAGVSSDTDPGAGDLDGGGFSYSAQALAAAGFTPGARITHDGLTFDWPAAAPGTPDNALASGQSVVLTGTGDRLGLLGAAAYGTASGTATVTFADGSTESFPLTLADWWSAAPAPGTGIVGTFGYINTPAGRLNVTVHLYAVSVALPPRKVPRYLTLPDVSARVAAGQPTMHIFAVASTNGYP
jgi:hypothetical protein